MTSYLDSDIFISIAVRYATKDEESVDFIFVQRGDPLYGILDEEIRRRDITVNWWERVKDAPLISSPLFMIRINHSGRRWTDVDDEDPLYPHLMKKVAQGELLLHRKVRS